MFRRLKRFSILSQLSVVSNVNCVVSEIHRNHGRFIWLRFSKGWVSHKYDQILVRSQDATLQVTCQTPCHGKCRRPCRVIFKAKILSGDSEDFQSQAQRLPHSWSPGGVPRQNHQEAKVRSNHHGVFAEVHWQFVGFVQDHFKSHHQWRQASDGPKRGSSQVWQRDSFTLQDSSRQTLVDVATQRWHQMPSQGVVKNFVEFAGFRLQQPQATPQVCQSGKSLYLHDGASDSSPELSRSHSSWDGQLLRLRFGRMSKIKKIN